MISHIPGCLARRGLPFMVAFASILLPDFLGAQRAERDVVHVRLIGTFDTDALRHIESALVDARSSGDAIVVLDLGTRGGSIAAAQLAVGSIIEGNVPVYAFVNPRAWGVGALIALAADSTFMTAEASLGWGSITDEEADLSDRAIRELRSEFRALAVRRDLDTRIAIAMIDPEIAIDGLVNAGERLTLSLEEAVRVGYAAGEADDIDQLMSTLGVEDVELEEYAQPAGLPGVEISVANNNWRDVRVTVVLGTTGSIQRTLGTVTSMRTVDFEIPEQLVTSGSRIRAVADVIGSSEQATTEWITAQSGLVIEWVIANVISQSNYFAYIRN